MLATTRLLNTERSQIQMVGIRGQWVISAYPQIARFLNVRLSQDHALLFAEPVVTAHAIDWFTAVDGPVQSFSQLQEAERAALLRQIDARVADILTLSQELSVSAQPDQQLIGETLKGMLVFPDQSLFLVGGQPVVAGWGLKFIDPNLSWRAAEILQARTSKSVDSGPSAALSTIKKQRQSADLPNAPIDQPRLMIPASVNHNADSNQAVSAETVPLHSQDQVIEKPEKKSVHNQVLWTGLMVLVILLLIIIGARNSDDIAVQWGEATTGPWPNTAFTPADPLAVARQRESQLRQELARLQAELLGKRRACAAH